MKQLTLKSKDDVTKKSILIHKQTKPLRQETPMMLRTSFRSLVIARKISFSCFSSASSTTTTHSPSKIDVLAAGAAADVAADDLLLEDEPASAIVSETLPTLLQPRVVVYDGVCHLCHKGVKWVIEADKHKKIKFCCLQSKAAEPYMRVSGLEREDVLRRFLFIEGPGHYHQGSTAALKVLSYLPLPYSALSSFMIVPTPLRDATYDYIAKRRYDWFGKEEKCLVLKDAGLLERFIDRDEIMGNKTPDL